MDLHADNAPVSMVIYRYNKVWSMCNSHAQESGTRNWHNFLECVLCFLAQVFSVTRFLHW